MRTHARTNAPLSSRRRRQTRPDADGAIIISSASSSRRLHALTHLFLPKIQHRRRLAFTLIIQHHIDAFPSRQRHARVRVPKVDPDHAHLAAATLTLTTMRPPPLRPSSFSRCRPKRRASPQVARHPHSHPHSPSTSSRRVARCGVWVDDARRRSSIGFVIVLSLDRSTFASRRRRRLGEVTCIVWAPHTARGFFLKMVWSRRSVGHHSPHPSFASVCASVCRTERDVRERHTHAQGVGGRR